MREIISEAPAIGRDIIIIADEPWEGGVWRRRHHVAWRLAKNNRVLFVDPPLREAGESIGVRHRGRNLYSVAVRKPFPEKVVRDKVRISWLNKFFVRKDLKQLAKMMGFTSPILWINFSTSQYDYFDLFNERLIVSDWYDMFTEFFGWSTDKYRKENAAKTSKILKKADVIFAVSKEISDHLKKIRDDIYFIPHGVDYDIFELTVEEEPKIRDIRGLKGPKIGYLGAIQHKVDFQLLCYIVKNRPDWRVILAGRKSINNEIDNDDFNQLLTNGNMIYIGEIVREQIPNYLASMDVCVVPFKKIEWTRYVSGPLKLWEYMAAGKPIVATDRGSKYECEQFVKVAGNKEEFVRLVDDALWNGNNPSLIEARKKVAKQNSWDDRVIRMMDIIELKLAEKQYCKIDNDARVANVKI